MSNPTGQEAPDRPHNVVPLQEADLTRPPPPFMSAPQPMVLILSSASQSTNNQVTWGWQPQLQNTNPFPGYIPPPRPQGFHGTGQGQMSQGFHGIGQGQMPQGFHCISQGQMPQGFRGIGQVQMPQGFHGMGQGQMPNFNSSVVMPQQRWPVMRQVTAPPMMQLPAPTFVEVQEGAVPVQEGPVPAQEGAVHVQDETAPVLAIGWKDDTPQGACAANETATTGLRRSTRNANSRVQGPQASTSGAPPSKRTSARSSSNQVEVSSTDEEEYDQRAKKVTHRKPRRENNTDSDDSQQDALGRLMDGEDSDDFLQKKKKISRVNQQRKVQKVEKRAKGKKKRVLSDSDSDFEAQARQSKRLPPKSRSRQAKVTETDSEEEHPRSKPKKSLSLRKTNARGQAAEIQFAGAPEPAALVEPEPVLEVNEVIEDLQVIEISDNESLPAEAPAAELSPSEEERMETNEINCPVCKKIQKDGFYVDEQSMPENFCTVCLEDFMDNETHLGILHKCGCSRFCFVCAARLEHSQQACPRCRTEISHTSSQIYTVNLLQPNARYPHLF